MTAADPTRRPLRQDGVDELDRRMFRLAKRRATVVYLTQAGEEIDVTLVAWRGRIGARKCRIQFRWGGQRTVWTHLVRPANDDDLTLETHP